MWFEQLRPTEIEEYRQVEEFINKWDVGEDGKTVLPTWILVAENLPNPTCGGSSYGCRRIVGNNGDAAAG